MLLYTCKEHKGTKLNIRLQTVKALQTPIVDDKKKNPLFLYQNKGNFKKSVKCQTLSPRQGKYNTILDNLSIGRKFPKVIVLRLYLDN